MDFIDYREKLGIGFCDKEKVNYFLIRVFNVLDGLKLYDQIDAAEFFAFCNITGTRIDYSGIKYRSGFALILEILHQHTSSIEDFLLYYMSFVNCQNEKVIKKYTKEQFKDVICNILEESHISYEVLKDKNGYFIFPKGAKELDISLVSEPLEWLSDYPNARKTYVTALKQYSERIYIRDVADNLRKALETFFQEFLGNTKNLETNKQEICKYLGTQGVDAGIAGLFQPLINSYKNINDRIAKHNDAVDEKLLEFLLYQTGVLIRMVITVKTEDNSNAD